MYGYAKDNNLNRTKCHAHDVSLFAQKISGAAHSS
jgi:hypothetical protein